MSDVSFGIFLGCVAIAYAIGAGLDAIAKAIREVRMLPWYVTVNHRTDEATEPVTVTGNIGRL